jgi:hypothetical protein
MSLIADLGPNRVELGKERQVQRLLQKAHSR